ncbi:MAG: LptA/OstA family protein [Armatimonadota bacterium]
MRRTAITLIGLLLALGAARADKLDLSADTTRWYPDQKIEASGNVRATHKDYTVTADSVKADLETNLATFTGNVRLLFGEQVVTGEALTMDLKTREWSLSDAKAEIAPTAFQGRLSSPAFVHGEKLSGEGDDIKIDTGTFTTCDLEHPHYCIEADSLSIYPGSKVIARGVRFFGLDRKLFALGALVIPTRGLSRNFIPEIGQSTEEGSYLKTSYTYTASEKNQGLLKLDLMQKRGLGTGLEHAYKLSAGSGRANIYYLKDKEIGSGSLTGSLQHHQKLGALDVNATGSYRTRSYLYYPTTTSKNWQLALREGGTLLSVQGDSTSGFGNNKNLNSTFRHVQQFGENLSATVSMDMRSNSSSYMPTADRELDSVIEVRRQAEKYDLSITASKRTDLDKGAYTGDDYYGGLDRLPEITLDTDTYRLGIDGLPLRLAVSAGKYLERPEGTEQNRLLLQMDMLGKTFEMGKSDLSVNAGLRQAFYGKEMAQYVLQTSATLTTRPSDYLSTRLTYDYQRPDGYSPFLFDYTGRYNYTRASVDYQNDRKLRWTLSTGYDFESDGYNWQDLALRLTAHPNDRYGFAISTGYDLNSSTWRTLTGQVQVQLPDRLSMDLGTRYDIESGRVSQARSRFKWQVNNKWKLEGITSWNGETRSFDYNAFRLTRDLHCMEASLTYTDDAGFRTNQGLSFEIRIKALPYVDRFGYNQYGQEIDTSMGEYYY